MLSKAATPLPARSSPSRPCMSTITRHPSMDTHNTCQVTMPGTVAASLLPAGLLVLPSTVGMTPTTAAPQRQSACAIIGTNPTQTQPCASVLASGPTFTAPSPHHCLATWLSTPLLQDQPPTAPSLDHCNCLSPIATACSSLPSARSPLHLVAVAAAAAAAWPRAALRSGSCAAQTAPPPPLYPWRCGALLPPRPPPPSPLAP
mmetsp:Transcript_25786/g.65571  ORF Transcript_25786/g.65571 Transcript_25786/m.65571 type:complete len:203 (+) Transcript_25786:254-862(+)